MLWLLLLLLQTDDLKETELQWRAEREESMKADNSWLNLVGLFWLKEGPNPFGSRPDLRIALPPYSTVEVAGTLYLEGGKVRYEMARGQRATVDGTFQNEGDLATGQILAHNHLRMFIIERGGKIALRVRDLRARNFVEFEKLDFYRPKEEYVVVADYEAFEEPKTIKITTVISTEIELIVPGVARFQLGDKLLQLIPTLETAEDEEYFFMFQDQTSGTTTYSGGRFLYTAPPKDGKITLDFNRAINPPCGYTVYATCPLPPAENWLDVAIEAGERIYLKDEHDL